MRSDRRTVRRPGGALRATLAGLLSSILPGLGQLLNHARAKGALLLALTTALAVGAYRLGQDSERLLDLLARPRFVEALLLVNAAVFLYRAVAAWDAFRSVPRRATRPATRMLLLGALLVFTLVPHVGIGYYGYVVDRTLDAVLAASPTDPEPSPATTPPTSDPVIPEPTTTTTTLLSSLPGPVGPVSTTIPELSPDDPMIPVSPWDDLGRLNVLLIGTDAGPGRTGARTDSMIVASIDPVSGQSILFGIPRNMAGVPLPEPLASEFECRCWPGLLNALFGYAESRPELFPDSDAPGLDALRGAITELLGIPIHHHVMVDMGGFVDVVDALGGVTLMVQEPIHVELSPPSPGENWRIYDIRPGLQLLDGHEALAYVRTRKGSSDYVRMHRQRCVLTALAAQAEVPRLLIRLPELATVIADSVRTDFPREQLAHLVRLAGRVDAATVVAEGFTPPDYSLGRNELGRWIPDIPLIRETAAKMLAGEIDLNEQPLAGEACGFG